MSFFAELKRRNVFKVAAAYVIIAWLLMQVGDTLAPALHLPEWINSALAFFLILGFPLAIFFAWAFEMTPEGIRREADVDRGESITQITGKKLNNTILVLMALALGYFAFDKFVLDPGRDAAQVEQALKTAGEKAAEPEETGPPELSIAVLPFVNMSADEANEYFSDGLTEELLNILAKIRELQVAGRTSSFAFKDKQEDLRGIGQKLNVKSILEGSVRKDDARNRVRITAQLINADDGYHLWSETYDRELDDIFAIQEEIAHEVARALRVTLLGGDEDPAQVADTDFGAYDLYLKGQHLIYQGGYVQLEEAVKTLQEALTIDPTFIPAKVGLITAWTELANTGAITQKEAIQRGLPMVQAVLEEQPGNGNAYVQRAILQSFEPDVAAAEQSFQRALELDGRNAHALQEYGRFLHNYGQVERGKKLIEAALEIEPYAIRVLWDHCQTNAQLRRPEVAAPSCERIQELEPESPLGYYGIALTHLYLGDLANTMLEFREAIERDPNDYEMVSAMSSFWTELGDVEQSRLWLQRAEAIGSGQPVPIHTRVLLYQLQERNDLAAELAERALSQGLENRQGVNEALRHTLAFTHAANGDFEQALAPYRETFPWAFEEQLEVPVDIVEDVNEVIIIAGLLKQANPLSERAQELLDSIEPHIDEFYPGDGIFAGLTRRALINTILGNHGQAIEQLKMARDQGAIFLWRKYLVHDPIISQLKGEPDYQNLIAWYTGEMERQREVAYQLLEVPR